MVDEAYTPPILADTTDTEVFLGIRDMSDTPLTLHPLQVACPYALSEKQRLYKAKFQAHEEATYHVTRWLCDGLYTLLHHYPDVKVWIPLMMPARHTYTPAHPNLRQKLHIQWQRLWSFPDLLTDIFYAGHFHALWSERPYGQDTPCPLRLPSQQPLGWQSLSGDTIHPWPLTPQHALENKTERMMNRHAGQLMCDPAFTTWLLNAHSHLNTTPLTQATHTTHTIGLWVIDDLYTTGATMRAMLTTLLKAHQEGAWHRAGVSRCQPWVSLHIPLV